MISRVCWSGFLMLLLFFGFTGCSKTNESIVTEQPAFSFSPSDTALFSMHGHLVSHIALDSSNYVEVPVRVHRAGPWEFTTGNVNGFEFSGSGNFTDSGLHIITLHGTGVPQTTGFFGFEIQRDDAVYKDSILIEEGYMDFTANNTKYSLSAFPGSNLELSSGITQVQASSQLSFRPDCEYRDPNHYWEYPHISISYVEFVSPSELGETFQSEAYAPGNKLLGNSFTDSPGFSCSFTYPDFNTLISGSVDQDSDSYLTVVQRQQFIGRYVTSSAGDSTDILTFKLKVKFNFKVGRGINEAGRLIGDGILKLKLAKAY